MSTGLEAAVVAAVAAAAVLAVAWPFLSPDRGAPAEQLSPRDRARLELLERRDAAYAGLRDLEQDHRTGKVSDDDYNVERRRLRAEAAEALRGLDRLESQPETPSEG
ncbi:MAG: hypothetical protein QOH74_2218 [Gaiellales bacterium]|nr:hypothetical protein [Gaiellales bacterium]